MAPGLDRREVGFVWFLRAISTIQVGFRGFFCLCVFCFGFTAETLPHVKRGAAFPAFCRAWENEPLRPARRGRLGKGFHAFPLGHLEIVPGTKRSFYWYCVHSNAPFPWRFLIRASVAPGLFILLKIKIYTPLVYRLKGISERRNSIFNAF